MKKLVHVLLALAPLTVAAQSQRLVLLEEFTQASCPPCAAADPVLHANLAAREGQIVTISYHTSWPGVDQMNAQNTADVATRVSYYGVTGVPNSTLDGRNVGPANPGPSDPYIGYPGYVTPDTIDSHAAVESPYDIHANHHYILHGSGHDSVAVSVTIIKTSLDASSSTQRLFASVVEREVVFATAPGTNGEKEFPYVMKKLLPSATGQTLSGNMAVGDSVTFSYKWKMANVYDYSQIAVVCFVQDNSTKKVHQAAYSAPTSPVPFFLQNVPSYVISGATSSADYQVAIETPLTTPADFKVYGPRTQVAGTTTKLVDGMGNEVDSLVVSSSATAPATVTVRLNVTSGSNLHGSVSVKARPADDTYKAFAITKTIPLYSQAPILVINRDAGGTSSLTSALTGRGAYAISAAEYSLAPGALFSTRNYNKIILSTGTQFSALLSSSQTDSLQAFLDNGGDLAVMGVDFGYFAGAGASYLQPFIQNYLGANFLADGPGAGGADGADVVVPVSGDTVAYSMINSNVSSASYDQLETMNGGQVGFTFQNSGTAAGIHTHSGESHTVYLAFPFNSINPASNRNKLMSNILAFFDDQLLTGVNGKVNLAPMAVAPNPTSGSARFVNLSAGDAIRVTDLTGRLVAEGTSTGTTLSLPMEGSAAGLYLATQMRGGAVVGTAQVSLVR